MCIRDRSLGETSFFLMIRRPPRSTQSRSSAASDVYKRQKIDSIRGMDITIVTSAKSDQEGKALLQELGMPFSKN